MQRDDDKGDDGGRENAAVERDGERGAARSRDGWRRRAVVSLLCRKRVFSE
jgi:hypothetical protein